MTNSSGKTKLVKSTVEQVMFAEGYVIQRKFEETSTQSCLAVVISAFDEINIQIARTKSPGQLNTIYQRLCNEFSGSLDMLIRILPNVSVLNSSGPAYLSSSDIDSNINMLSLCFMLQRFMKVLAKSAVSGMLFLDDMQWCDSLSLALVQSVLSGQDNLGLNSMLLVGSYRDDFESNIEHVHTFENHLHSIVPCNTIHLGQMPELDVNFMISDALCTVPRLCVGLTSVVHRKTGGNPFFIRTFLNTLVDNKLLTYSLWERRWTWDLDKIGAEQITDNVLYLISSKMTLLHEDVVMALKIASCFGIKVHSSIIQSLSASHQYSTLQVAIDRAVQEGCMDFDEENYCFVHDKVRETAYGLIGSDERDRLHYEIGMSMYSSCIKQVSLDNGDTLFTIIEQINHGVPSLLTTLSDQISVAQLNFQAGISTMNHFDFVGALMYLKIAASLLPTDAWKTLYGLSLKVNEVVVT